MSDHDDTDSVVSEEVRHAHVHAEYFKNISREPIGYNTKSGLTGLNGVEEIFG